MWANRAPPFEVPASLGYWLRFSTGTTVSSPVFGGRGSGCKQRIIRWEVQQDVAAGEAARKEVAADAHEEVYQLGYLMWNSDRRKPKIPEASQTKAVSLFNNPARTERTPSAMQALSSELPDRAEDDSYSMLQLHSALN